MKKIILTAAIILSSLSFMSCVDDSYDLENVKNDNNGLGDKNTVISVPIGDIAIPFDEIMENITRAVEKYRLKEQDIKETYELPEGWLNEEIRNTLTNGDGTVTITAKCSAYPTGFPGMTIDLDFSGETIFDKPVVINSKNTEVTTDPIDDKKIEDITKSTELTYSIHFDQKEFECDIEELEDLIISISITKSGPIIL